MKFALIAFFACQGWGQISMRGWKATESASKTVAKRVPKDVEGYLVEACNMGQATIFNPGWVTFFAPDGIYPQDSAAMLTAAEMARDGWWPKLLRVAKKTFTVGAISTGVAVATGGLSIPAQVLVPVAVGTALSPSIEKELKDQTAVNKPANFLSTTKDEPAHSLGTGTCEFYTFAAAKGGPPNYPLVQVPAPSEAPIRPVASLESKHFDVPQPGSSLDTISPRAKISTAALSAAGEYSPGYSPVDKLSLSTLSFQQVARTHPMVDDLAEHLAAAERLAATVRERSASLGATQ
jgi:hypothetical protein